MSDKSKEEQQGRIMPLKDFRLEKFKLTKEGVNITHYLNGTDPQTVSVAVESTPHPDLINKMDELRLYMATRLGLLLGWDFARDKCRGDLDVLQEAKNGHQQAVDRMNVNGLTFKGEGDTYGVCITGSVKTPHNGSVGLSTPKISFNTDVLGYEQEVVEICDEIKEEIYNYLILKKKEQTNIEDQAEGFDNDGGQTSILNVPVVDAEEVKPKKGKAQETLEKYQGLNKKGKNEASDDAKE